MVLIFVSLIFLVSVTADQCPDNLINTNYTESMGKCIFDINYFLISPSGCIHADTSIDEYFDTYDRALNFCKYRTKITIIVIPTPKLPLI